MTIENENRVEPVNEEVKPLADQSPSEKLETETPISPATPGVESAESDEVKGETSPNTE